MMNPNDRPYITFRRTLNKGVTKREPTLDKDGKVVRAGHPGEFEEDWVKALVSHKGNNDPYSWVSAAWVMSKLKSGCVPIGCGNLDKLPANYPKEWKAKLVDAISSIEGMVNANNQMLEMKAKLEAENADLKKQAEERGSNESKQDSKSGKSTASNGQDAKQLQEPSGKAGQAAHV